MLLLLASTIGATVTPWMVFFQQASTADKGMTTRDIGHGRFDTALGAGLAAVFGVGALVAGAALATHNGANIQGLAGAGFPAALETTAGKGVATVFALGLIEAGAVAVLTISASTAYAAAECVGATRSLNSSPRRARLFYATNLLTAALAAVVILIPGAPLLSIVLNANVLATVLLPVTLVFLVMLANDRGLMGAFANKRATNIVGMLSSSSSVCAAPPTASSASSKPSTSSPTPPDRANLTDATPRRRRTCPRKATHDHLQRGTPRSARTSRARAAERAHPSTRPAGQAEFPGPGRPLGPAGVRDRPQHHGHLHLHQPALTIARRWPMSRVAA